MTALPKLDTPRHLGARPYGLADQLLADIEHYGFDLTSVSSYTPAVVQEIKAGVRELRSIGRLRARFHLRPSERKLRDVATRSLSAAA